MHQGKRQINKYFRFAKIVHCQLKYGQDNLGVASSKVLKNDKIIKSSVGGKIKFLGATLGQPI